MPVTEQPITKRDRLKGLLGEFSRELKRQKMLVPRERRLPITIPPNKLDYYRSRMKDINRQSAQDLQALTLEEQIAQSAQEGAFVKARIKALRRSLGVAPWPRGNRIVDGEVR